MNQYCQGIAALNLIKGSELLSFFTFLCFYHEFQVLICIKLNYDYYFNSYLIWMCLNYRNKKSKAKIYFLFISPYPTDPENLATHHTLDDDQN